MKRRTGEDCKKKSFSTIEEARTRIIEIRTEDKSLGSKPRRAYQCPFCGLYHITSMNSKTRIEVRAKNQEKRSKMREEAYYWCKKLGINNNER